MKDTSSYPEIGDGKIMSVNTRNLKYFYVSTNIESGTPEDYWEGRIGPKIDPVTLYWGASSYKNFMKSVKLITFYNQ